MALRDWNSNAFLDDSDGSIWVGTPRGLSHLLNPEAADSRGQDTPPVLTRIQLGGLAAPQIAGLSVPYARRSLDVAFSALTFVNEESMHFRHRLLGLDDTWSETRQLAA